MGIYFNDIKDLKNFKKGDKIVVLNDLSNEYCGLKLFEDVGVIKLKDGVEEKVMKKDIVENLFDFEIVEFEVF